MILEGLIRQGAFLCTKSAQGIKANDLLKGEDFMFVSSQKSGRMTFF